MDFRILYQEEGLLYRLYNIYYEGTYCELYIKNLSKDEIDVKSKNFSEISDQVTIKDYQRVRTLNLPMLELINLKREERITDRVFTFLINENEVVAKVARFGHELEYIYNEIKTYHIIKNSTGFPNLIGYITENSNVTGIVLEKIDKLSEEKIPRDHSLIKSLKNKGIYYNDYEGDNLIKDKNGREFIIDFESCIIN